MQVKPSEELLPFIKHYLFLQHKEKDTRKFRLFSDGNTGMVFSFGHNLITDKNELLLHGLPTSFLYGQPTQFRDIYLLKETSLIIVVFQPAGLHQLTGISADELRDKIITADYLFGKEVSTLQEKLTVVFPVINKFNLLNAFFTSWVSKRVLSNQLLTAASLQFIIKNKGLVTMTQLVKFTGYTERHIERKFMECVGIPPKKFGNIVKLHHFLSRLKGQTCNEYLTGLAYETGYADQSHLIKEFRKYTGVTPKNYVTKAEKLTNNFIALLPAENIY